MLILWAVGAAWLAVAPFAVGALLRCLGLERPNYRGERIPAGWGLSILIWSVPVLLALAALLPDRHRELAAYVVVVAGFGVLGFADDLWGNRRVTGLRGHFRAAGRGEITTGFVKAVGGAALAVLAPRAVLHVAWANAALDGAVIALCANAFNLLDLRPGRACAAFLLVSALAMTPDLVRGRVPGLAAVWIPASLAYERDARAQVMLGDTGSNPLGGALGLALVLDCRSAAARIGLVAGLVALHIAAERVSLSRIIERSPVLRRLDALTGRRDL